MGQIKHELRRKKCHPDKIRSWSGAGSTPPSSHKVDFLFFQLQVQSTWWMKKSAGYNALLLVPPLHKWRRLMVDSFLARGVARMGKTFLCHQLGVLTNFPTSSSLAILALNSFNFSLRQLMLFQRWPKITIALHSSTGLSYWHCEFDWSPTQAFLKFQYDGHLLLASCDVMVTFSFGSANQGIQRSILQLRPRMTNVQSRWFPGKSFKSITPLLEKFTSKHSWLALFTFWLSMETLKEF